MTVNMHNLTTLLLNPWRRQRSMQKKKQKESRNMCTLPPEIVQLISSFLPLSSAVTLIICSHQMLYLLGDQALHSLRLPSQRRERKVFLGLMERDLPNLLLCHHCEVFQAVPRDESVGQLWRYREEPGCVRLNDDIFVWPSYRIRFPHVQLLMNNYRFGRPYREDLERFSYKSTLTVDGAHFESEAWACIMVGGELLVRINSRLRLATQEDINKLRYSVPWVCCHLRELYQGRTCFQRILCQPCHDGGLPCGECSGMRCCNECSTWFQVCGRELTKSRREIRIDVWKYLGKCETPFDKKWSSQVGRSSIDIPDPE